MLRTKYKNIIKKLTVGLAVVSSLAFLNFTVHYKTASAANACNPNIAACCQTAQFGVGNGSVSSCFNSSGQRNLVVVDNSDGNINPEKGHCYTVRSTPYGLAYYNADCSIPPFNFNWQSVSCTDGSVQTGPQSTGGKSVSADTLCKDHGGVAVLNQSTPSAKLTEDCTAANLNKNNCGIIGYLVLFINALSALVGIVVVIVIIVAGIQWSTAGNNPQQINAARTRIVNALLALLVFIFMYAFLQWLVPGGIF